MIYIIFDKSDIDGMLSYYLLYRENPSAIGIPLFYDDMNKLDIKRFTKDDTIYICDLSLRLDMLRYLTKLCKVIWIDHHISAIKELDKTTIKFYKRITRTDISACGLVWEYLYPDKPMPKGVEYCTKYDSWTHNNNFDIIYFNYGIYSLNDFRYDNADIWEKIILSDDDFISDTIKRGEAVFNYNKLFINKDFSENSVECEIEGHKSVISNSSRISSLMIENLLLDYDIVATFKFNIRERNIIVSLYSEKVDVSKIVKNISPNSGGHKGAAGLVWDKDLNTLLNKFKVGQV